MTRNQKILLSILGIYVLFDFVLGSLVGLYLWESTKDANSILIYYITLFSSITVGTQLASKLVSLYGSSKIYILSIVLGMFQSLILLTMRESIGSILVPFGALAGFSIGLQAIAYTLTVSAASEGGDTSRFIGIKSALMNFVSIVGVPLITYLIKVSGSYSIAYQIGLVSGFMVIYLISMLPANHLTNSTIKISGKDLFQIEAVKTYVVTRFLYGVFNGPSWAILGVVTYIFVGDVSTWGIVSTFFTTLSIIGAYFYGKLKTNSLHQAISIAGTFIFGTVAVILATNWNFIAFLVYQIGLVILNTSFAIHYENLIYSLIREDPEINNNSAQILSMGEIAIGIGRVLPLIILLISGFSFDNTISLQLLFVLISGIPLVILSSLSHLIPHSQRYATINS